MGQTAHRLTELAPGGRYAFIVGSIDFRFGVARWSEWAYLTLAEAPATSCPTDGGEPTATPAPTPTPTPGATPGPEGTPAPTAPTPTPSLTLTPTPTPTLHPTPAGTGNYDYDADEDGLIEVASLAQLDAIRADLDGDGVSHENGEGLSHAPAYAAAFPNAKPGMGCPYPGCTGYELVADLDFDTNGNGEADAGDAYWNDGAGWIPIGHGGSRFTADFDGNNHVIANLHIDRGDANHVGLFGYTWRSSVKQVGLVSATVSGNEYVGGLVGYSHFGTINGSYATGSVAGGNYVGGLVGVGYYANPINGNYATGSVTGNDYVGGLIGHTRGAVIDGSYTTGTVSGDDRVGGLVGSGSGGGISGSYTTGSVSGNDFVGGLAGHSHSGLDFRSSYATGSVAGDSYVGGLVGYSHFGNINTCYATGNVTGNGNSVGGLAGFIGRDGISDSYAMGNVTGGDYVGGLVGAGVGYGFSIPITTSYATGQVSPSGDALYIGGLVGYHQRGDVEITASYWDTQTTGLVGSYGGVGKTTAELQSPTDAIGIYADWDAEHWDFGNPAQYPVLKYGRLDVASQRR